ncbi:MAG: hypothetical protein SCH98_10280 [Deferrisomatales bacterium]|nr:hypothetical protein [Deferrisomatales bacterium]
MTAKRWICLGTAGFIGALALGCGDNPDDAGNRLVVAEIQPADPDHLGFIFPAVEEVTADVGCPEGDLVTANNRFWDGCVDETYVPMSADFVNITFRNETRPGVSEGRPLEVTDIVVNYFDPGGNTPLYAPTNHAWSGSFEVPPDGSATLVGVPITTLAMKAGDGTAQSGLRGLFFTQQVASSVRLTAVVDIFARDSLNKESVSTQTRVQLTFVNPNPVPE